MAENYLEGIVRQRQLAQRRIRVGLPAQVKRELFDLARKRGDAAPIALTERTPLVVETARPSQLGVHASDFGGASCVPAARPASVFGDATAFRLQW